MSRTGILIVTHNSAAHIGACLDAVHRVRGTEDVVLVIDNASKDGIASIVQSPARFIQNETNLGFAGAVNQGFRALKDDVDTVLLLNPDVILHGFQNDGGLSSDLPGSHAVPTLIEHLTSACRQSGLACGRLTDASGKTQIGFTFRRFPTPLALLFETLGLNKFWKSNPINRAYRCLEVDHLSPALVEQPAGAMLMIRTDVWALLQGFDESFFPVWFEDVDFCLRASRAGFRAAYLPTVVGVHEGGHSVFQIPICKRKLYWYASLLRYSRKHFGVVGRGVVAAAVAATGVSRALIALLQLRSWSLKDAAMNLTIARTAFVYPPSGPAVQGLSEMGHSAVTNEGIRVSNEGISSNANTERTLKRLHAR